MNVGKNVGKDKVNRVLKMARTTPVYRRVRGEVVPRLRRSKPLRRVVTKIWSLPAARPEKVRPGSFISPGRLLAGRGSDQLPRLGVLALGCSAETLTAVVADLAHEQVLSASFSPVLVLDQPHFAVSRRYGYVTELLPPPDDAADAEQREEALVERLAAIAEAYQVSGWLRVGPDGLDDVDRTLLRVFG